MKYYLLGSTYYTKPFEKQNCFEILSEIIMIIENTPVWYKNMQIKRENTKGSYDKPRYYDNAWNEFYTKTFIKQRQKRTVHDCMQCYNMICISLF